MGEYGKTTLQKGLQKIRLLIFKIFQSAESLTAPAKQQAWCLKYLEDLCLKCLIKRLSSADDCAGVSAGASFDVEAGDTSRNPKGWGIGLRHFSFGGGGGGYGGGLKFGIKYCWCDCDII